ncbi:transposase [Pandoraea sputorum]|uniref:transposase n=1 Tax=Pandoraea sputorum TaxID=93222 RepID=UPI00123F4805
MPKYAPELNDIERRWRELKRHYLANRMFRATDVLDNPIPRPVLAMNRERAMNTCHNLRMAT